jgi:hypothetical protein
MTFEGRAAMKRSFLSKLHTNGIYYSIGALLLLIGVPLYQYLVLLPLGYSDALTSAEGGVLSPYLTWIGSHTIAFLGYRALSIIAFVALISLPFTLFRIIVAQELLGSEETEHAALVADETDEEDQPHQDAQQEDSLEPADIAGEAQEQGTSETRRTSTLSWRGKGFAVLAAWAGLLGIILYTLGSTASALYSAGVSNGFAIHAAIPGNFQVISEAMTIVTYTIGGGLLAIASLFFGAMIVRSGLKLWPGMWVAFGYTALAVAALLSVSAVAVVSAPIAGKAALTTPAFLLFALWVLWFGVMLARLKPEP